MRVRGVWRARDNLKTGLYLLCTCIAAGGGRVQRGRVAGGCGWMETKTLAGLLGSKYGERDIDLSLSMSLSMSPKRESLWVDCMRESGLDTSKSLSTQAVCEKLWIADSCSRL